MDFSTRPLYCVFFGIMSYGLATSGDWRAQDSPLARTARQRGQFAEAVVASGLLKQVHVKGHSGDPWNELADVVAGTARGTCPLSKCAGPETEGQACK